MKKLFAIFLLLFLIPLSACAVQQSDSEKNADSQSELEQPTHTEQWIEIQNITYFLRYDESTQENEISISSEYVWDADKVSVSKEEAEASGNPIVTVSLQDELPVSGHDDEIESQLQKTGKTEYIIEISFLQGYYKVTYIELNIYYVYVNLYNDGSIGIRYNENNAYIEKRIKPLSYEITYFSE